MYTISSLVILLVLWMTPPYSVSKIFPFGPKVEMGHEMASSISTILGPGLFGQQWSLYGLCPTQKFNMSWY